MTPAAPSSTCSESVWWCHTSRPSAGSCKTSTRARSRPRCARGRWPNSPTGRHPTVSRHGEQRQVLALDGKTVRGAHIPFTHHAPQDRQQRCEHWARGYRQPHLVSVLDQATAAVLGQVQVAGQGQRGRRVHHAARRAGPDRRPGHRRRGPHQPQPCRLPARTRRPLPPDSEAQPTHVAAPAARRCRGNRSGSPAGNDGRGHGRVETRSISVVSVCTRARTWAGSSSRTPPKPSRSDAADAGSPAETLHDRDRLRDHRPPRSPSQTGQLAPGSAATGRSRTKSTGSATSPTTKTDPRSAPAPDPRSWPPSATPPSAHYARRRHQHRRRQPPPRPRQHPPLAPLHHLTTLPSPEGTTDLTKEVCGSKGHGERSGWAACELCLRSRLAAKVLLRGHDRVLGTHTLCGSVSHPLSTAVRGAGAPPREEAATCGSSMRPSTGRRVSTTFHVQDLSESST